MADAGQLLQWRNDPEVRAASHATGEVDFLTHVNWLQGVLANPRRKLYIAEVDGSSAGMVRADQGDDGVWVLSWLVAPDFRRRGVGKRLLTALFDMISAPMRAEIKSWNTASIRIAEAAGMRFRCQENGLSYFEKP